MTDILADAVAVPVDGIKPLPIRRDSFWAWIVTDKKELSDDNLITCFRNCPHFKTYEEALKAAKAQWNMMERSMPASQAVFVEIQPLKELSRHVIHFETKVSVEIVEEA